MYSYKDFENFQPERLERNHLKEAYSEYVAQYKKDHEHQFYRDHKHDHWFLEKYDPSQIYFWKMK